MRQLPVMDAFGFDVSVENLAADSADFQELLLRCRHKVPQVPTSSSEFRRARRLKRPFVTEGEVSPQFQSRSVRHRTDRVKT